MEWVETTGTSVDAAVDRALDLLGVEAGDAEVVVVTEPRRTFLGLRHVKARVRARVRPTRPRPKQDRRDRRRREGKESRGSGDAAVVVAAEGSAETDLIASPAPAVLATAEEPTIADRSSEPIEPGVLDEDALDLINEEGDDDMDRERDGTLDVEAAEKFVVGLAEAFGAGATATVTQTDDFVDIDLEGEELGLLIGPRGQTLQSIQELARAVAQRGFSPQRLRIDVGGYRKRRQEALVRFALQIAEEVVRTGSPRALEPMPSPDRKVVHDAVQGVEGAVSTSEGEDPQRRVIISPA